MADQTLYKAFQVNIYGRVTGVGFRFFALRRAGERGQIKGWIRNAACDQVEAVCQGNEAELRVFLHDLSQGPDWSRVDDIKINKIPLSDQLKDFHIR